MKKRPELDLISKKHEPENLRLVAPGAILFGMKCSECGGFLVVPQRGPTPETCSAKCRVRKHRRLRAGEQNLSL